MQEKFANRSAINNLISIGEKGFLECLSIRMIWSSNLMIVSDGMGTPLSRVTQAKKGRREFLFWLKRKLNENKQLFLTLAGADREDSGKSIQTQRTNKAFKLFQFSDQSPCLQFQCCNVSKNKEWSFEWKEPTDPAYNFKFWGMGVFK